MRGTPIAVPGEDGCWCCELCRGAGSTGADAWPGLDLALHPHALVLAPLCTEPVLKAPRVRVGSKQDLTQAGELYCQARHFC